MIKLYKGGLKTYQDGPSNFFNSAVLSKQIVQDLFSNSSFLFESGKKVNNHLEQTAPPASPQTEFSTCMGLKNFCKGSGKEDYNCIYTLIKPKAILYEGLIFLVDEARFEAISWKT